MRWFFLVMVVLTTLGCVAVRDAQKRFYACKDDPACYASMMRVQDTTYAVTKTASDGFLPSIGEALAVVVSGFASFLYGVRHGKKKGG